MVKYFIHCCFVLLFLATSTTLSRAVTLYTYTNGGSSGTWSVAGTWTTDPSGATLTGSAAPGNSDVVYILNGFTVNLTANVTNTGLTININSGGVLDLKTFQFTQTISILNGSGTLKIGSGYFPTITTNNFLSSYASGATVEFGDFTGSIPTTVNYPNLNFTNSTTTNYTISFSNTAANSFTVNGNLNTQISSTGTLTINLGTQTTNVLSMTISGNMTIGTSTTFQTGAFNAIHNISLAGNLTNNGTVDLSNGTQYTASTTGAANFTFTGATDNTLACNGRTDFYTMIVNKGTISTNILSVTSTSSSNFNLYSSGLLITITNGTLKLGSNISITKLYGTGATNYDLGSSSNSPMLWINGATVNTGSSAFVVYGKFKISAGSFTCTGNQGTVIREEGQYIIEGGTFTTEKFRPSTTATTHRGSFTMTGGTFNASGTTSSNTDYARFSLPYPEQVFIMSGGTINVSNPESATNATNGGIHIGCQASNYSVTGGTINAILSGTASYFDISSTVPFYNFGISRTGGTPTTVRLNGIGSLTGSVTTAQNLLVLNTFSIDGTNTPVFNANGKNVELRGNFTIGSGATYTPGSNTTTFSGTNDQIFTNDGTITSGLNNLTINKSSGRVTIAGTNTTLTVSSVLTLSSGVLDDGGKTINVAGNISNSAIHTGTGTITLNGVSTQTLSGDGNGIFGNLTLNNISSPGVTLTSHQTISGVLTLAGTSNSLFDIGIYRLSLTSTSASALTTSGNGFSSAKMIRTSGYQSDAGIKKTFGNLNAFTYAFGVGSTYLPATIQLTSTPTAYGSITARPVNSRHQFVVAGNTNNLTCYWKLESSGFTGLGATGISHTYQYIESSVSPGGDDVNYIPARHNLISWTLINNTAEVNDATNAISFSNVGYIDGDFTAGVPAAFGTVKIFYSKRNGNWTNVGAGTTPWSNVSHSGADATTYPTSGDQVYIGDGVTYNHTITVSSNTQSAGGMEISYGSVLDIGTTTGHNFGAFEDTEIFGSGTLRISSSTANPEFPAGDFGRFIRSSGGTVEYYTTGGQSFTIPLTSAAPTSLPLISYRSLAMTPGAGSYIAMPNQNQIIYENIIVQGASSTGLVKLNATTARTLTVNGDLTISSGNLQFQNGTVQTLQVDGDITIGSGAIFDLTNTGTAATNLLTIGGNIINNGTFDMSNTSSYVCNVTFTGSSNASITGTGSVSDFNTLTISKGSTQTYVLEVNATAFTLSATPLPLVISYGTFRLTSTQTITFATSSDFTVPSTGRLSANGGTLQLTGSDGHDLILAGTLEVLNGTINIGTTSNDNSIEYSPTGSPTLTVSGGTLNVKSQIRRPSTSAQGTLFYNQSGSSYVVAGLTNAATTTRGVFEILNSGSSFTMSGGTLRIIRGTGGSSIADAYIQPSTYSVSGGTVEIGTSATSQTVDINSTASLNNLTVTGTTNTARLELNGLTLLGTLNIGSGCIFNANSLNVSIGGDFVNSNSTSTTGINVGGYQVGSASQTTTFNSASGNQTLTGVSSNLTNFGNLTINNTFSGGTISLQSNTNVQVNGTLTITTGTLAGGTNTITSLGTVSNSSTHTSSSGSITLAGASNQTISGNGSGKFGNLTLNNSSGATFSANQEITGILTFSSGSLTIGVYALNISNTSLSAINGTSSSKYIITSGRLSDGGLIKTFAGSVTNGSFTFPIGISGKYTPVNYTITTGATGGSIKLTPVNGKHPSATGSGTAYINYYWNTNSSIVNLSSLTHTYTYVASDESGTTGDYRDARLIGGAWTVGVTSGNPNTTSRIISFTNTDLTGDYTAGEATAFVNPTTYTSIGSGNWESDAATWSPDPPGTNIGPPDGSFVIIDAGHTITNTSNSKRIATLEVRGRLNVATTTGHDFGTVTASGSGERTIQLKSSIFPTGDFSSFTATNGGTIEYDGTVTLPPQEIYNNLSFTSSGTKTLANVNLSLNGNLSITAGTVSNSTNNRNITLSSSTGDFTNNGSFISGTGTITIGRDLNNSGSGASFTAGSGTGGLHIGRNLNNTSSATFNCGSDSLRIIGNLANSATFNASSGAIRTSGNLNNTGGTFTGSSGIVAISGTFTNNATYSAGTGATSITGSFINSGSSATFSTNANALTLAGDFTNSSSGVFSANTGSVSITGNWSNSGTFNANTASVIFNSSSSRSSSGATTFYNLTKSGGGSLTINNDIIVSNTLTLTNGNIITGSNTISLSNTSSQPTSGQSSSSFIDGKLIISYPNTASTSRIFPVGSGSKYRPVTVYQGAASTSPVVRVQMIDSPPSGSYTSSLSGLSEVRYFKIDLTSGTINSPTVELNFNTNGTADESISVPGNVHIARATSSTGSWTDEGGSGVFSPSSPAGYSTSGTTSLSNPSYFTLAYQSQILPVELMSFSAILKDDEVKINWTTSKEINNDYFIVERSSDGTNFQSINTIDGSNNSNVIHQYSTIDYYPLPGISYYRLKQVDKNENYSYSRIASIYRADNTSSVTLYPNPCKSYEKIYIKLNPIVTEPIHILITDLKGILFSSHDINLTSGQEAFELDLNNKLKKGVYIIHLSTKTFHRQIRLIIKDL